jgi:16S rRNA (cytosine967-C5)-methyltransferase
MTPSARLQAAIDIVDEVIAAARSGGAAADTLIARYFKARRYAGSKDRRAVRDLAYAAIRRGGEIPATGRAALIGVAQDQPDLVPLFDGSSHGPAPIAPDEAGAAAGFVPQWLAVKLSRTLSPDEVPALLGRAPLDLRVNRLKASRDAVLRLLPEAEPGLLSPDALRLPEGTNVEALPAFEQGLIEVQDEGSQLIALASQAAPGMTVVDLCAGAGGKTLALAAMMAGQGRLIACDIDRGRLARLAPRAVRAGAANIETLLLDGGRESAGLENWRGQADVVLVDAPCSGSGTWRRNPEARWRLTPQRLERLMAMQAHVLALAAPLVKPGGRLVYAVCSLLEEEGAAQIAAFRAAHPGWTVDLVQVAAGRPSGDGLLLTPAHDHTDGFFIAGLCCPC